MVVEYETGVPEASGLAPLPDGRFLIVDDERGVFRFTPGASSERLAQGGALADLEGVCVNPAGDRAWVLSERDGSVWSFGHDDGAETPEKHLGRLPKLAKSRNRGWEGIAFLPAGTWAPEARLLAVHQGKPRVVMMCDPHTLAAQVTFTLPRKAKKALDLLNDLAVNPKTGEWVVISGKRGRIATLARRGDTLDLVGVHRIPTDKDDVPEGIGFDPQGRLWIVTDGRGRLLQLELP